MNTVIALIEIILLIVLAIPVLYLLVLAVAAAFYRPSKVALKDDDQGNHPVILIPAHNEALTLPATLEKIKALRTGNGNTATLIVVVADNCTDNTADLARQTGVMVLERFDDELKGKGHALEWAIDQLMGLYPTNQFDSLVIFDADTLPDPAFLRESLKAIKQGAVVVQGCYDILNPGETWRTKLLYTAFVIFNHIRPLGRAALKFSDGLRGNGMVFRRAILERIPWQAFSLVEDIEYANRLVMGGYVVTYAPTAKVFGQAAAKKNQASVQRMRWEGGRFKQAKQDVPVLLVWAFKKGSFNAFDRAMDLIIPPLAILALGLIGFTILTTLTWVILSTQLSAIALIFSLILILSLVIFVLGGLMVARAPLWAYTSLILAPGYILWKLPMYARMLLRRGPTAWERTPRAKIELSDLPPEQKVKI